MEKTVRIVRQITEKTASRAVSIIMKAGLTTGTMEEKGAREAEKDSLEEKWLQVSEELEGLNGQDS